MGISRDSWHKRRLTSGKPKQWRKKKKYELGRVPGNTKLVQGNNAVRRVRTRGGHFKFRALRLDSGNFAWPSEAVTHRTRLLDVTYNASNNELVRTKALVKNAVVQIDATPFRMWYERHYGVQVQGAGKHAETVAAGDGAEAATSKKLSNHAKRKIDDRKKARTPVDSRRRITRHGALRTGSLSNVYKQSALRCCSCGPLMKPLEATIEAQFGQGRLYALVTSRPGQCGRCDGYILEGKELDFYVRKMQKKKSKAGTAAAG